MAKFIPLIGEIYTAVESAICIGAAGLAAAFGDTKAAGELTNAAGNAWVEYAEGNAIATPIYLVISDINGDHAKSDELREKYIKAADSTANGIPVVGHVKGVVHYAMGDTEKGHEAMIASTRSTAVLGAGVLTGGLGGGLVLGATAAVGTGLAYDGTATLTDRAVNGEKAKLHGSMALIEADKMTPNELTQAIMGIAGDGLSGAAGAKLGKNIRGHLSKSAAQKNLVKTYTEAGVKDPRQATGMTMETAKAAKEAQKSLQKNVNGCTTKIVDRANGKSEVGHSGKIRNEMRAQHYQKNGYPSKGAARSDTGYGRPSHLQETYPEVRPVEGRSVPQNACAEHQAFNHYNNVNPGYNVENARTSTVYNRNGTFTTIERCDNCQAYGPHMGDVVTDRIQTGTLVPPETYVAAGSTIGAWATAAGGAILQKKRNKQYS